MSADLVSALSRRIEKWQRRKSQREKQRQRENHIKRERSKNALF